MYTHVHVPYVVHIYKHTFCSNDDCQPGAFCLADPGSGGQVFCVWIKSKDCYLIQNVVGQWTTISSSSGKQTVSYQEGTTHSGTTVDANTWGGSVTTSVSAGFDFFGAKGSASVSGTVSHSIAHSYSSTFSSSQTVTKTYDFGPGVVWLWKFNVESPCGNATSSGHDLALTPNSLYSPCCLPGMFLDITKPNGGCLPETPNLCTGKQLKLNNNTSPHAN